MLNNNTKSRNYAIDFIRMVCTIIICLHHFQEHINTCWINNGQLCVEFFFILSGFYLYKTFLENKEMSTIEFTKSRIKTLYPHYIYSLGVILIVRVVQGIVENNLDLLRLFFGFISEGLLVQKLGIYENILNWPLWYVCVLIFAGIIIFELLKRDDQKFFKIYSILIILFYFNLHPVNTQDSYVLGFYIPFLRGLANMTIGCILYAIYNKIEQSKINKIYGKNRVFFYAVEFLAYILLAIIIVCDTPYNNYCIILFSTLILLANIKETLTYKLFNRKIFKSFGSLTYAMYCNHGAVVLGIAFLYQKFLKIYVPAYTITIIYIIIVIIYSIITRKIVNNYTNKKFLKERE